jgi:hypothetical protein
MGLGPTLLAVSWTEFAVVSVLFGARFYVNAVILQRFKADFWWATVTYVRPPLLYHHQALLTRCLP